MAKSSGVQVDSDGLRSAGSVAQSAAAHPGAAPSPVTACANDHVSVAAADVFSARIHLAHAYTAMANMLAEQLGVHLGATATTYTDEDALSAALLGQAAPPGAAPAAPLPPMAVPALDMPAAPPMAAGEVPTSSRDIARLLHAGPGPHVMHTLAQQLQTQAGTLDQAAATLAAARTATTTSWNSEFSDTAANRIAELQQWYEHHAAYHRNLAAQVTSHASDFDQARHDTPTPQMLDDKDRELREAVQANQRSRGLYTPVVNKIGAEATVLKERPVTALASYGLSTLSSTPAFPAPEPPPRGPSTSPAPTEAPGSSTSLEDVHRPAPSSAPTDPVEAGGRGGVDENTSGPLWPPTETVPAAIEDSVTDPLTALPAEALPSVMPAVIGGAVGGLGGALGGFSGAARNALGGMQQAPTSDLGQPGGPPSGGGQPESGQGSQTPEEPPDFGADDGGGTPGDTEPSWEPSGPLSAPAGLAAPEVAAPSSTVTPAAATPVTEPAGGAPMGGAMMPPMMGGPRGGGRGSERERQLYQQRRLKVVAPPNSEPVKGRREPRRTDTEDRSRTGERRG